MKGRQYGRGVKRGEYGRGVMGGGDGRGVKGGGDGGGGCDLEGVAEGVGDVSLLRLRRGEMVGGLTRCNCQSNGNVQNIL